MVVKSTSEFCTRFSSIFILLAIVREKRIYEIEISQYNACRLNTACSVVPETTISYVMSTDLESEFIAGHIPFAGRRNGYDVYGYECV